jgi:hypothetical protein
MEHTIGHRDLPWRIQLVLHGTHHRTQGPSLADTYLVSYSNVVSIHCARAALKKMASCRMAHCPTTMPLGLVVLATLLVLCLGQTPRAAPSAPVTSQQRRVSKSLEMAAESRAADAPTRLLVQFTAPPVCRHSARFCVAPLPTFST